MKRSSRTQNRLHEIALLLAAVLIAAAPAAAREPMPAPADVVFVAHGGGAYKKATFTNTIEAIEENYRRGYRFFEIDFKKTDDGRVAIVHGWGTHRHHAAMKFPNTHENFLKSRYIEDMTVPTFERLESFLTAHPDAWIITDVKFNNLEGLAYIAANHPRMAKRTIPQAFSVLEYERLLRMGYPNVILALYRKHIAPDVVFEFLRDHRPYAISMSKELAAQGGLPEKLRRQGVRVFVHVVNEWIEARFHQRNGATGFYSDFLSPGDAPANGMSPDLGRGPHIPAPSDAPVSPNGADPATAP